MEYHSALALEVSIGPQVVIASKVVYFNAVVGQLGKIAKEACKPFRHSQSIFVPKVEHVAEQVDSRRFVLDFVEEAYEATFLCALVIHCPGAEMGIGKEIYIFHVKEGVSG